LKALVGVAENDFPFGAVLQEVDRWVPQDGDQVGHPG
jgi:hypothetical protein